MKRLIISLTAPLLLLVSVFAATPAIVIQSESVSIHVKADGSVEKTVSQTMKLNTFQAIRTVGEWFYSYNPKLEQVKILKSVTIHKDGKQFPAPENAILDQTPAAVENAPDFSNIREKMVSHTGLEPGCTVEFQYKTTDLSPHRCGLLEPMGGVWPIRKKTVKIQLDRKAEIFVNGKITRTAAGSYEVKNTPSIRPAYGFSDLADTPFIYIEIDNPVNRVKQVMGRDGTLEPTVLDALKLNKNSAPLEVETALNHFLNQRVVTVYLKPELTGWTSRSLPEIVKSGYATPLEKILLAHRVLNAYHVPHTAALITDKIDSVPVAVNPQFRLVSDMFGIYPSHGEKSAFVLWGNARESVPVALSVSVELKEGENGNFSGTIKAEKNCFGTDFSLAQMNPLKNATVSNETVLLKTENKLAKSGKITLKISDKPIQLNPVLAHSFHLSELARAALTATSIRMPNPCNGVIHISIEFREKPKMVLPEKMKAVNQFGSTETIWQLHGNILTIQQKFQSSPFRVEIKDFDKVNALLAPILNQTASVAFLE